MTVMSSVAISRVSLKTIIIIISLMQFFGYNVINIFYVPAQLVGYNKKKYNNTLISILVYIVYNIVIFINKSTVLFNVELVTPFD